MAISLSASAGYGYGGKQFIARITGRDSKYTFAREFIGRKGGKRGEGASALVDQAGMYQTRDVDNKGRLDDSFCLIWLEGGELRQTSWVGEEDAMPLAKMLDDGEPIERVVAADYEQRLRNGADKPADETITTRVQYGALAPGQHQRWAFRAALLAEISRLRGEIVDRAALEAERAKLQARLAEIDQLLTEVKAA